MRSTSVCSRAACNLRRRHRGCGAGQAVDCEAAEAGGQALQPGDVDAGLVAVQRRPQRGLQHAQGFQ
jgi:hypothetical protein